MTRAAANQQIPDAFAAQLRAMRDGKDPRLNGVLALAVQCGWTCKALAAVLGISAQAVGQRVRRARPAPGVSVPLPSRKPQPVSKPERRQVTVPPHILDELRRLQKIAATVRGSTPVDDPRREVSRQYTALLASLVEQGVPASRLSRMLGLGHTAVHTRLRAHGYGTPSPSQRVYRGVHSTADVVHQVCLRRGHPMVGDNLYVTPSGARLCRTCLRARQRKYKQQRAVRERGAAREGGGVS